MQQEHWNYLNSPSAAVELTRLLNQAEADLSEQRRANNLPADVITGDMVDMLQERIAAWMNKHFGPLEEGRGTYRLSFQTGWPFKVSLQIPCQADAVDLAVTFCNPPDEQ